MRLLLDTHTILWMVGDDPRLPDTARRRVIEAEELFWSIASLWEIGIKVSLGRPDFLLRGGWARWIPEEMIRNSIHRLDIRPAHCEVVSTLSWHHRDPFDRLLVSQAISEKLAILSRDPALDAYGIERVW